MQKLRKLWKNNGNSGSVHTFLNLRNSLEKMKFKKMFHFEFLRSTSLLMISLTTLYRLAKVDLTKKTIWVYSSSPFKLGRNNKFFRHVRPQFFARCCIQIQSKVGVAHIYTNIMNMFPVVDQRFLIFKTCEKASFSTCDFELKVNESAKFFKYSSKVFWNRKADFDGENFCVTCSAFLGKGSNRLLASQAGSFLQILLNQFCYLYHSFTAFLKTLAWNIVFLCTDFT